MAIPLPNPDQYTIEPKPGFVPTVIGVRRVSIDVNRDDDKYTVSLTPCPANETAWGPEDMAEVTSQDLVAELYKLGNMEALQAVQRIKDDLIIVADAIIKGRE